MRLRPVGMLISCTFAGSKSTRARVPGSPSWLRSVMVTRRQARPPPARDGVGDGSVGRTVLRCRSLPSPNRGDHGSPPTPLDRLGNQRRIGPGMVQRPLGRTFGPSDSLSRPPPRDVGWPTLPARHPSERPRVVTGGGRTRSRRTWGVPRSHSTAPRRQLRSLGRAGAGGWAASQQRPPQLQCRRPWVAPGGASPLRRPHRRGLLACHDVTRQPLQAATIEPQA